MQARRLTAIAALCAIGAAIACSDSSPVAPKSVSAPSDTRTKVGVANATGRPVRVLRWSGSGLPRDITGSASIGKRGGVVTIGELGVTFTVPAGALTRRKTITVTALAGHHVVFQMAPDGTHFRLPATLRMDLTHTNALHDKTLMRLLVGGYIPSVASIGTDDSADDTEDYPAVTNDSVTTAAFPVPHFSVVILASQVHCSACNTPGQPPR
jgi:hypothetical protein